MNRIVQPELLDELPPDDPRAVHSRRDLRRINAWMRNHAIMANALQSAVNRYLPRQITDLGAGNGDLLLRVAREISPRWKDTRVILLDRQKGLAEPALNSFTLLGWHAETVQADVFDWLSDAAALDVVVANLFLHHFNDAQLVELFRAIASRARLFVAIEPHRSPWTSFWCRWLWAIGCNAVTRHDAAISVCAGFSGRELSALWPANKGWELTERRSGFFSHSFVAQKNSALECADMSAFSQAATCRRSP